MSGADRADTPPLPFPGGEGQLDPGDHTFAVDTIVCTQFGDAGLQAGPDPQAAWGPRRHLPGLGVELSFHEASGRVRHRHGKPTVRQTVGRFKARRAPGQAVGDHHGGYAIASGSTRTAHTLTSGVRENASVSGSAPARWKGMKTVSARIVSVSLTLA